MWWARREVGWLARPTRDVSRLAGRGQGGSCAAGRPEVWCLCCRGGRLWPGEEDRATWPGEETGRAPTGAGGEARRPGAGKPPNTESTTRWGPVT